MNGSYGLGRIKKAKTSESFSASPGPQLQPHPSPVTHVQLQQDYRLTTGWEQSFWGPPGWSVAVRPPRAYQLEVVEDGDVVDVIQLDKHRNIFGRQNVTCDYVLDHPSVSDQHAALVQHSNGSVYVIDLGSVHGTFIGNQRLTNDNPIKFESGQSLHFATSSRSYILKENASIFLSTQPMAAEFSPPHLHPADNEVVVASNNIINCPCTSRGDSLTEHPLEACNAFASGSDWRSQTERAAKRPRCPQVTFRDEHGGVLAEVVGTSDGADVSDEPGPVGVKEGSFVGK